MHTLTLNVLERNVSVRCPDLTVHDLFSAAYGSMQAQYGSMRDGAGSPDLEYRVIEADTPPGKYRLERFSHPLLLAADDGQLLAGFDGDLAIEIQRLRPDLYVVHAAVLTRGEQAVMLVAKSGGGKSTLSWALLHHGFQYSSDELAPIRLTDLNIHPYPRALMVKRSPPPSYPMTPLALRTSRGFHVPAHAMPGAVRSRPAQLAAIFFLQHAAHASPGVRRISAAEGAARLYVNTLNPLAHAGEGLDAAVQITMARPCFELTTSELGETCALIKAELSRLSNSPST